MRFSEEAKSQGKTKKIERREIRIGVEELCYKLCHIHQNLFCVSLCDTNGIWTILMNWFVICLVWCSTVIIPSLLCLLRTFFLQADMVVVNPFMWTMVPLHDWCVYPFQFMLPFFLGEVIYSFHLSYIKKFLKTSSRVFHHWYLRQNFSQICNLQDLQPCVLHAHREYRFCDVQWLLGHAEPCDLDGG